jgi:hypothetical protein
VTISVPWSRRGSTATCSISAIRRSPEKTPSIDIYIIDNLVAIGTTNKRRDLERRHVVACEEAFKRFLVAVQNAIASNVLKALRSPFEFFVRMREKIKSVWVALLS